MRTTDGSPDCWAVITGASSGIGESTAHELAARGFNVLLIARRADRLQEISLQISSRHKNVKTSHIEFDLSNAFDQSESLMRQVLEHTGGARNIAIVAHFAGTSDLARHFTDKNLTRNVSILRLQCEATLVVLQAFCQALCTRPQRSAIITAGALPAYAPMPGFALASANKSFVRALSLAAAYEYKDKIDIMCAHPIAVESEIVVTAASATSNNFLRKLLIIPSKKFALGMLGEMGKKNETNGSWVHDLCIYILCECLPRDLFNFLMYKALPRYAKILNREVDMRELNEKV